MRGRDQFKRFRLIILAASRGCHILPLRVRLYLFYKTRNILGNFGLFIRYVLLKSMCIECGDNVAVFPGAYILNPQFLSIGSNVSIHPMCYIECGVHAGDLIIGSDISIAHGVTIIPTTHNFVDVYQRIKDQGVSVKAIRLNDDIWIGAKASILGGCEVGTGCVIGANSVVTRNTERYGVYVGAPARLIKYRN